MANPNQFPSPGGIKLRAWAGRTNPFVYPNSVGDQGATEDKVSFKKYVLHKDRKSIMTKYNNISIVMPPDFAPEAMAVLTDNNVALYPESFREEWLDQTSLVDITEYASAFFHGMNVTLEDLHLRYTSASVKDDSSIALTLSQCKPKSTPETIGIVHLNKVSNKEFRTPTWRIKYNDLMLAQETIAYQVPYGYATMHLIKEHLYTVSPSGRTVVMLGFAPPGGICTVSLTSHMELLTPAAGAAVTWPATLFCPSMSCMACEI
jgi:hypothetical protein